MTKTDQKQKRFYGRRQSRPLNKSRAQAMELLPLLSIPEDELTEKATLSPSSLYDKKFDQYWLEIGFGSGEHLSALLRRHPENAYIGCEPYINGMAAFLKDLLQQCHSERGESRAEESNERKSDPSTTLSQESYAQDDEFLSNIRVHMDDAVQLCRSIADQSLDGIYILNPDPWHKKRHHKRRIVRPETLDIYARILKPGGQLVMSTDVPYLADWMITHAYNHPAFEWSAQSCKDWQNKPSDWVTTAYEGKGAKGAKKMCYLFFERQHI
ncbi:MAG: tRNA (guanine(46)-N(7))-methyltransferase TrmB [Alphaproteobacteria bacterium]